MDIGVGVCCVDTSIDIMAYCVSMWVLEMIPWPIMIIVLSTQIYYEKKNHILQSKSHKLKYQAVRNWKKCIQ